MTLSAIYLWRLLARLTASSRSIRESGMKAFARVGVFMASIASIPAVADVPRLTGYYLLVPGRGAPVEQAVDKVVAEMNPVVRQIARSRLSKTNQPYRHITLAATPATISIATDRHAPIEAPADGTPVNWRRDDNELLKVSMQWKGRTLQEVFAAEDGKRVNVFELSPDGRELKLMVTVTSDRLPKPLSYTLVYQRQ